MKISLICEKCLYVHNEDTDGANLVVDFKNKYMSFICQNKKCKHDNIFSFENWQEKSKSSPLPRMRIV
jgi:hypothetical protein